MPPPPPRHTALHWDAQPGPPACSWASAPALQLGKWMFTSELLGRVGCFRFIQGLASLDVMGLLPHLPLSSPPPRHPHPPALKCHPASLRFMLHNELRMATQVHKWERKLEPD